MLGVIQSLYRWRRLLLVTAGAVMVGSLIISFFLPNYYSATTVFYAANPDMAKPAGVGEADAQYYYYGTDDDNDRLLTIANSSELAQFLIDSFNLYTHYEIDKTKPRAHYKVMEALKDHFEVIKTKYNALELTIEDKDPERAHKMANAARDRVNYLAGNLIKESQKRQMATLESNIKIKETDLQQISDSLYKVKSMYGIVNYTQGEVLAEAQSTVSSGLSGDRISLDILKKDPLIPRDTIAFLSAKVAGDQRKLEDINARVEQFNQGLDFLIVLSEMQRQSSEQLSRDRERLKQLQAAVTGSIPSLLVVEKATKPDIKSRPKRSLIVITATVLALIFASFAVLLFESYKEFNWQVIKDVD